MCIFKSAMQINFPWVELFLYEYLILSFSFFLYDLIQFSLKHFICIKYNAYFVTQTI